MLRWSKLAFHGIAPLHLWVALPSLSRASTNPVRLTLKFSCVFLTVDVTWESMVVALLPFHAFLWGHSGCPGIRTKGQVWAWGSVEPSILALSEADTGSKHSLSSQQVGKQISFLFLQFFLFGRGWMSPRSWYPHPCFSRALLPLQSHR